MSEILKFPTWNQKQISAFLANVFWCQISCWNIFQKNSFPTLSIWIFTWKRHLRQCNIKSVENMSRKNENKEKPTKKSAWSSLVPVWIFQYFRHYFKNPFPKIMACFSNNHYWAYTSPVFQQAFTNRCWAGILQVAA